MCVCRCKTPIHYKNDLKLEDFKFGIVKSSSIWTSERFLTLNFLRISNSQCFRVFLQLQCICSKIAHLSSSIWRKVDLQLGWRFKLNIWTKFEEQLSSDLKHCETHSVFNFCCIFYAMQQNRSPVILLIWEAGDRVTEQWSTKKYSEAGNWTRVSCVTGILTTILPRIRHNFERVHRLEN